MRSKFCLTSTDSFNKINKSLTNRSATKQTFSFAKGNRFDNANPTCPRNTYDGDFYQRKPSASAIGNGNRSDFTKCLTVSPSSNKYHLKSFWDENASKNKGAVIGLSRDRVSFNSYIPKQQLKGPSPTQYRNQKSSSRANSPKYTLRQKTVMLDKTRTIESQNKNPGPGSYINPQMDANSSMKQSSKFQKISYGQAKSQRFRSSETIAPGPGKYRQINDLQKTGQYVLSKSRGGTKAKFDRDMRESMFDKVFKKELQNPGPGYYKMPSEFGQYDGEVYQDLRRSKRSTNGWKLQSDRVIRR